LLAKQALSRSQQNGYTWTLKSGLVRDVINGVGHQRYINRLEQRTSDPNIDVDTADENLEQ